MKQTEQIDLKKTDALSLLCHRSKNLYNQANYIIRQKFLKHNTWNIEILILIIEILE